MRLDGKAASGCRGILQALKQVFYSLLGWCRLEMPTATLEGQAHPLQQQHAIKPNEAIAPAPAALSRPARSHQQLTACTLSTRLQYNDDAATAAADPGLVLRIGELLVNDRCDLHALYVHPNVWFSTLRRPEESHNASAIHQPRSIAPAQDISQCANMSTSCGSSVSSTCQHMSARVLVKFWGKMAGDELDVSFKQSREA
jgi:hypothetical protein